MIWKSFENLRLEYEPKQEKKKKKKKKVFFYFKNLKRFKRCFIMRLIKKDICSSLDLFK